jgi:hypothetical protein
MITNESMLGSPFEADNPESDPFGVFPDDAEQYAGILETTERLFREALAANA